MKKVEDNPFQDEKNPCDGCVRCCEYVAMEIDEPDDKDSFQQIRWFLAHKDVWIFIDHDGSWNIQFNTKCENLGEEGWCEIYNKRPQICGEHSSEDCDKNGEGDGYTTIWKTMEEFDEWLEKEHPDFL